MNMIYMTNIFIFYDNYYSYFRWMICMNWVALMWLPFILPSEPIAFIPASIVLKEACGGSF